MRWRLSMSHALCSGETRARGHAGATLQMRIRSYCGIRAMARTVLCLCRDVVGLDLVQQRCALCSVHGGRMQLIYDKLRFRWCWKIVNLLYFSHDMWSGNGKKRTCIMKRGAWSMNRECATVYCSCCLACTRWLKFPSWKLNNNIVWWAMPIRQCQAMPVIYVCVRLCLSWHLP